MPACLFKIQTGSCFVKIRKHEVNEHMTPSEVLTPLGKTGTAEHCWKTSRKSYCSLLHKLNMSCM